RKITQKMQAEFRNTLHTFSQWCSWSLPIRKKDLIPTPHQQSLFLINQRRSLKRLEKFPKEALCFFYYLFESFTIGITFNAEKLLSYVVKSQFKDVPPTLNIYLLCYNGSFLPPRAVNDDGSVMYHAPYCFIHDWYKVNPSSRRCERKLRTLYADTRSLMARANGVEPDKIPYYVMWNISVWNKDHPDAYKWIEANGQWLYDNFDHCDVETSDDDDDARSLWSSDDDEHFDPFEDDPTHPDARWSP
ncbi:hypothetical protein Tco_0831678, partial [Tanacetum coccineum]